MKFLTTVLGLASAANAHTLFTTLFIDGENQGDGTCVRQPKDASKANSPIYPIDGAAMACGENGGKAVQYTCPAQGGAKLTFQFRESPSGHKKGAIAEGHRGPCSVYMKKVDDMKSDSAAGDGWFKVFEDGYNVKEDKWCVDRLIENKGLLSVDLPTGLPAGYYLVRPEILALHSAPEGDPQFYQSCAQIFIENGPEGSLEIPEKYETSIPGYVTKKDPAVTFNIYDEHGEYPIHGPPVWNPTSKETGTKKTQKDGLIPKNCLAKNANWCGKPVAKYSDQTGCWDAAKKCWDQVGDCWDNAPPTGGYGCDTWNDYCQEINDACKATNFNGPPAFSGKEHYVETPGPIPAAYGNFKASDVTKNIKNTYSNYAPAGDYNNVPSNDVPSKTTKTVKAPAATTKASKPVYVDLPSQETATRSKSSDEENTLFTDTPVAVAPRPIETFPVKVSEDGRCGGETGQTCEASKFGDCCSRDGKCGRKTKQCGCGCQSLFGICNPK
ncbi:uncharacterized protein FIESC28_06262 [Fusarium coffeatum]|uniref:lytic cellulose monooxygenase (C4-dehydrogenating) n=1 Tax=Fusarium coffeatum TaxID=231269 RepID=A0A366RL10_9HYPO|nr:uncharacterized protein FIESC28_06262 [Fusarium coffeatum]RBR17823.1 hypothetical protein FIESC28_06262 [Fusarium coffeatum]